ncbi:MAG TPA: NmrA/HSCARG family protein [Vicinamibacteria bacterium]|nr:NmrA/HSCARG family protein [Vicinamibacteria bacterium]
MSADEGAGTRGGEDATAKKIIAILGATGAQGGSLVRAILADGNGAFLPLGLTRHPESDKAQALRALGAEVRGADADDVESLRQAFGGAYGAFCVTNFWEHFSPEREIQQAQNMARAAKDTSLRHVIWSTLEDTRRYVSLGDPRMPTLKGRYKVPHFDAKEEANQAFRDLSVPTTFLYTSFYWDNLIHFGMGPKPGPDGKLHFVLPMADKKLPSMAAEDIGRCAYGVFQRKELIGQSVGIAGEHLTGAEMARELTQALKREVVHEAVPPEVYRTFGFPGADDLGNMFQFNAEFEREFCARRDLGFSRALNPQLKTFHEWLGANKERIPIG